MSAVRVTSARTAYANTPETDKLPEVWHRVTLSDGTSRLVMAAEPRAAIDKVNAELLARRAADDEILTVCCGVPFVPEGDLCSGCGEHTTGEMEANINGADVMIEVDFNGEKIHPPRP